MCLCNIHHIYRTGETPNAQLYTDAWIYLLRIMRNAEHADMGKEEEHE